MRYFQKKKQKKRLLSIPQILLNIKNCNTYWKDGSQMNMMLKNKRLNTIRLKRWRHLSTGYLRCGFSKNVTCGRDNEVYLRCGFSKTVTCGRDNEVYLRSGFSKKHDLRNGLNEVYLRCGFSKNVTCGRDNKGYCKCTTFSVTHNGFKLFKGSDRQSMVVELRM